MRLLKITREETEAFDSQFKETDRIDVEDVAPTVIDGETGVNLNGKDIEDFDAVYARIPKKNVVFGRVMLETLEQSGLTLNYPSTGFFIMAKKNYLYSVLNQKDVKVPSTVVVASEKASRGLQHHLDTPVVARRFSDMKETERRKIEEVDEMASFVEGMDYPEEMVIFQELTEGEKYRCLCAGDQIISLHDGSESWKFEEEKLKYSSMSGEQKQTVQKTASRIGTPTAEIVMRNGMVYDVNPNPDLDRYTETSGKNAYEAVGAVLRGE